MSLFIEARKKGIPGMTRMRDGFHKEIGTIEELMTWFRNEGLFIQVTLSSTGDDITYHGEAIVMSTGEVRHELTMPNYRNVVSLLLGICLQDLPDKKGVKM